MNEQLELKKRVINEIVNRKEALLAKLNKSQQNQLKDAQADDMDFSDYESPKEQIMDEVIQKTESIDFLLAELAVLKAIRTDEVHEKVSIGSLVSTNVGYFLIGVSQEQFLFEDKKFTGISQDAALYQKMQGLKKKAEFHFGNIEYILFDIV